MNLMQGPNLTTPSRSIPLRIEFVEQGHEVLKAQPIRLTPSSLIARA
jgi:hypothetical protein